jgi:hypothetical protein
MDDIEVRAVKKTTTQQTQQEEEGGSIDWRIVGMLGGALAFAVLVGFICWNAHGWFVRPTFAKARAEIESKFGSDVADAFDETNRACSDDVNLTKACGLLYGEIKKPPVRVASANVQVPQ